ncbi:MarR family transcriptional regulator, partial [Amycolatopsis sp. NPDC004625]|uniref:MarR family winged helix-turn-helix transcriptional regulator n=1 Tax=Amycolatopsis sp. NPDC004625 TaxID=3154670 RepID=UPI0033B697C3
PGGLPRPGASSHPVFGVVRPRRRRRGAAAPPPALGWEKSRVAHLLTRMENRGLVARTEDGATGRRTGIELTGEGRRTAESAVRAHGANIRRLVLDRLAPEQTAAIRAWSEQLLERS